MAAHDAARSSSTAHNAYGFYLLQPLLAPVIRDADEYKKAAQRLGKRQLLAGLGFMQEASTQEGHDSAALLFG